MDHEMVSQIFKQSYSHELGRVDKEILEKKLEEKHVKISFDVEVHNTTQYYYKYVDGDICCKVSLSRSNILITRDDVLIILYTGDTGMSIVPLTGDEPIIVGVCGNIIWSAHEKLQLERTDMYCGHIYVDILGVNFGLSQFRQINTRGFRYYTHEYWPAILRIHCHNRRVFPSCVYKTSTCCVGIYGDTRIYASGNSVMDGDREYYYSQLTSCRDRIYFMINRGNRIYISKHRHNAVIQISLRDYDRFHKIQSDCISYVPFDFNKYIMNNSYYESTNYDCADHD
jgi:hypothetical protein